jgi:hypothetical protein
MNYNEKRFAFRARHDTADLPETGDGSEYLMQASRSFEQRTDARPTSVR